MLPLKCDAAVCSLWDVKQLLAVLFMAKTGNYISCFGSFSITTYSYTYKTRQPKSRLPQIIILLKKEEYDFYIGIP